MRCQRQGLSGCQKKKTSLIQLILRKTKSAIHDEHVFFLFRGVHFCWGAVRIFLGANFGWKFCWLPRKKSDPEVWSGGPSMFRWKLVLVDVGSLVNEILLSEMSVKGYHGKTPKNCKACFTSSLSCAVQLLWFTSMMILEFQIVGLRGASRI